MHRLRHNGLAVNLKSACLVAKQIVLSGAQSLDATLAWTVGTTDTSTCRYCLCRSTCNEQCPRWYQNKARCQEWDCQHQNPVSELSSQPLPVPFLPVCAHHSLIHCRVCFAARLLNNVLDVVDKPTPICFITLSFPSFAIYSITFSISVLLLALGSAAWLVQEGLARRPNGIAFSIYQSESEEPSL